MRVGHDECNRLSSLSILRKTRQCFLLFVGLDSAGAVGETLGPRYSGLSFVIARAFSVMKGTV
jgi:hypothetical protein